MYHNQFQFQIINFKVFNRWSQVVFDGSDTTTPMWDGLYNGVEQPIDVYIYIIEFKSGGEVHVLRGEVTLIRQMHDFLSIDEFFYRNCYLGI